MVVLWGSPGELRGSKKIREPEHEILVKKQNKVLRGGPGPMTPFDPSEPFWPEYFWGPTPPVKNISKLIF